MVANESCEWADRLSQWILRLAVCRLPDGLKDRFSEEWRSHLDEVPGRLARVTVASGFVVAAIRIRHHQQVLRRVVDFLIALFMLIAIAPVMLLAALAVFADVGRPIFCRQLRTGHDGKKFLLLGFR